MMEEEYRMQKAQAEGKHHSSASEKVIHEDGTVSSPRRGDSLQGQKADRADDDASTRGVVSPTQSAPDEDGQGAVNDTDSETLANADGLPTIRISTESAREQAAAAAKEANGHGEPKENGIKESAGNALEKPVQAAENNQDGEGGQGPSQEPFSFSNKRLCERWLDNLFMVLYEVRLCALCSALCMVVDVVYRIYECGPSSAPRSRISRRSMLHTGRRASSGRS